MYQSVQKSDVFKDQMFSFLLFSDFCELERINKCTYERMAVSLL